MLDMDIPYTESYMPVHHFRKYCLMLFVFLIFQNVMILRCCEDARLHTCDDNRETAHPRGTSLTTYLHGSRPSPSSSLQWPPDGSTYLSPTQVAESTHNAFTLPELSYTRSILPIIYHVMSTWYVCAAAVQQWVIRFYVSVWIVGAYNMNQTFVYTRCDTYTSCTSYPALTQCAARPQCGVGAGKRVQPPYLFCCCWRSLWAPPWCDGAAARELSRCHAHISEMVLHYIEKLDNFSMTEVPNHNFQYVMYCVCNLQCCYTSLVKCKAIHTVPFKPRSVIWRWRVSAYPYQCVCRLIWVKDLTVHCTLIICFIRFRLPSPNNALARSMLYTTTHRTALTIYGGRVATGTWTHAPIEWCEHPGTASMPEPPTLRLHADNDTHSSEFYAGCLSIPRLTALNSVSAVFELSVYMMSDLSLLPMRMFCANIDVFMCTHTYARQCHALHVPVVIFRSCSSVYAMYKNLSATNISSEYLDTLFCLHFSSTSICYVPMRSSYEVATLCVYPISISKSEEHLVYDTCTNAYLDTCAILTPALYTKPSFYECFRDWYRCHNAAMMTRDAWTRGKLYHRYLGAHVLVTEACWTECVIVIFRLQHVTMRPATGVFLDVNAFGLQYTLICGERCLPPSSCRTELSLVCTHDDNVYLGAQTPSGTVDLTVSHTECNFYLLTADVNECHHHMMIPRSYWHRICLYVWCDSTTRSRCSVGLYSLVPRDMLLIDITYTMYEVVRTLCVIFFTYIGNIEYLGGLRITHALIAYVVPTMWSPSLCWPHRFDNVTTCYICMLLVARYSLWFSSRFRSIIQHNVRVLMRCCDGRIAVHHGVPSDCQYRTLASYTMVNDKYHSYQYWTRRTDYDDVLTLSRANSRFTSDYAPVKRYPVDGTVSFACVPRPKILCQSARHSTWWVSESISMVVICTTPADYPTLGSFRLYVIASCKSYILKRTWKVANQYQFVRGI